MKPPIQSSLRLQCQAPVMHLSRQITRTTAETMESSWFYWLSWAAKGTGFSYTVLANEFAIRLSSVTSTFWNICESRGMWRRSRRLKASWKSPCIPLRSRAKPHINVTLGFPASARNLPFCPRGFHQSRRWRAEDSESRLGEKEGAGLARGDKPRHRYLPHIEQGYILHRVHKIKSS